jgi:uncharacterized protein YciI
MQFIVTGHDGTDAGALDRRMAARDAHMALSEKMFREGNMLFGLALLDDKGKMRGSVMVCEFPDDEALDAWLRVEPYITGKVWEKVDIQECKLAPPYQGMVDKARL